MIKITPDQIVYFKWQWFTLNATIVFTWVVIVLLVLISLLATRKLSSEFIISRSQNFMEVIVGDIRQQIQDATGQEDVSRYIPFIGTLFLFIALSNLLVIVPGYHPPTGSLSTTGALAFCVFLSVPIFAIQKVGLVNYLKTYVQPTPLMLPFKIIENFTRTLAMAIRLFGNIMSGTMIAAILLSIAPFFFPILIDLLGLITGIVQAYILSILALVYIISASREQDNTTQLQSSQGG